MTFFIEQFRYKNRKDGKVFNTACPVPVSYLKQALETTKDSGTIKTVAVFIIKPKQIKP